MVEIDVLFFRPYNEKMAVGILVCVICLVVIFGLVKGVIQCGKN